MKHFIIPRLVRAAALSLLAAAAIPARAELIYAYAEVNTLDLNTLISFDSATPGTVITAHAVSGLQPGETLRGIDFRPANGRLYGLGSLGRLYTLDVTTGAATFVGAISSPLNGLAFGFDFNPVVDRIRVLSDLDQNLRINPNDGTLAATDVTLAYSAGDPHSGQNPNVTAAAYANNVAGVATTTLYGIDTTFNTLVTINPPNNGTLTTVGPLGVAASSANGFDISSSGIAYAALARQANDRPNLYRINLATGVATLVGQIGPPGIYDFQIHGLAVVTLAPPVIVCSTNIVTECTGGLTPASYVVSALDSAGTPLAVTCMPPSGSGFHLGTSNVTCTATSTAGQTSTCTFTVTVVDTTPPQMTCPEDVIVQTNNAAGAVVNYSAGAFDPCGLADFNCSPQPGSLFPIGTTVVTCTASDPSRNTNSCGFQVTVLGARGIKLDCLTNLVALRASVTNRHDGEEFDDAIEHLTRSLDPALWIDQILLQRKGGDKVFEEEKKAVHELVELLKDNHSTLADADLHALIDCILRADRLLAVKAVDEAEAAGVKPKKVAEDRKEIDKGDDDAAAGKYEEAIEHYRNAWKHAVHIKIDPPHRLAAGGAHLTFIGIERETYVIQATSDLIHWTTIGTATANADGEVVLDDPAASGPASRFYRVVSQ